MLKQILGAHPESGQRRDQVERVDFLKTYHRVFIMLLVVNVILRFYRLAC
jgi:hypothetical protein